MAGNLFHACLLGSGGFLAIFGIPWFDEVSAQSVYICTWCSPCVYVYLPIFPFYKDTHHIGLGPHTTPVWLHHSLTNYIRNDPLSKQVHILRHWGLGLGYTRFWEDTVQPWTRPKGWGSCLYSNLELSIPGREYSRSSNTFGVQESDQQSIQEYREKKGAQY